MQCTVNSLNNSTYSVRTVPPGTLNWVVWVKHTYSNTNPSRHTEGDSSAGQTRKKPEDLQSVVVQSRRGFYRP